MSFSPLKISCTHTWSWPNLIEALDDRRSTLPILSQTSFKTINLKRLSTIYGSIYQIFRKTEVKFYNLHVIERYFVKERYLKNFVETFAAKFQWYAVQFSNNDDYCTWPSYKANVFPQYDTIDIIILQVLEIQIFVSYPRLFYNHYDRSKNLNSITN